MLEGLKMLNPFGRKSMGIWAGMKPAEILVGAGLSGQATNGYRNPYVYACINKLAETCAAVPWLLYTDRTMSKEIEHHAILDLLAEPNPLSGGYEFIRDLVGYHLLNGNAFLYGPPNSFTGPLELYVLRPDWTTVIEGGREEPIARYQYSGRHGSMSISVDDMVHWKCWNPLDELRGLSPLMAAAISVQSSNDARQWNASQLQNGGKTSGIVTTDGALNDKQRDSLKQQMRSKYSGPNNTGKVMVLEGGMHWEQMGMTAVEMDFIQGQRLSAMEIALIYKTPPELIGDSANKTYSNFKEANQSYARSTVVPKMDELKGLLNHWLVPKYKGQKLYLDYDKDAIEGLREARSILWGDLNATNWLTINEKRAAAGYDPIGAEGDVVFVPMSNMPIDQAAQPYTETPK